MVFQMDQLGKHPYGVQRVRQFDLRLAGSNRFHAPPFIV
jgi:hypothetical protein